MHQAMEQMDIQKITPIKEHASSLVEEDEDVQQVSIEEDTTYDGPLQETQGRQDGEENVFVNKGALDKCECID